MHSNIAVMKVLVNIIRTAGSCELKGIRHYIHYSQPSLTTRHNGNKYKNVMCNTCISRSDNVYASCTKYVMFMLALFLLHNFITIMIVMKI